ncbi:MAG TPA: peroxiredoxin [Thermoplasmata archaeon]|nr:peroxiredoxin [Thermoplasmata archaeon]
MLAEGDVAPDFEGRTSTGETIRLSSFRGKPVVVYFYPKANTLGCTRESIEFAHEYPTLQKSGAEVIGISVDDQSAQARFSEQCRLPFPLVADADREISRRFGVLGAFGRARRVTFILSPEGRIDRIVESILPGPHVREAARHFGARSGDGRPPD